MRQRGQEGQRPVPVDPREELIRRLKAELAHLRNTTPGLSPADKARMTQLIWAEVPRG